MKLRVVNQFGSPLNLQGCDGIKISIPYENGEVLEKNRVTILDMHDGKIQIELDEFEVQGLKVGSAQSFRGEFKFGDTTYHVVFAKGLNVGIKDERKAIV